MFRGLRRVKKCYFVLFLAGFGLGGWTWRWAWRREGVWPGGMDLSGCAAIWLTSVGLVGGGFCELLALAVIGGLVLSRALSLQRWGTMALSLQGEARPPGWVEWVVTPDGCRRPWPE